MEEGRRGRRGLRYYAVYASVALMAAGLLAQTLWPRSQRPTSPVPRDADHADLGDYRRCPSCHGPGSRSPMPASGAKVHLALDGRLRADFVRCYRCHGEKAKR